MNYQQIIGTKTSSTMNVVIIKKKHCAAKWNFLNSVKYTKLISYLLIAL